MAHSRILSALLFELFVLRRLAANVALSPHPEIVALLITIAGLNEASKG